MRFSSLHRCQAETCRAGRKDATSRLVFYLCNASVGQISMPAIMVDLDSRFNKCMLSFVAWAAVTKEEHLFERLIGGV